MKHASLFSGIGGPEVAAAMLGWENVFHCEINPFGRAVLDYWFPNSRSYDDITKTDFKQYRGQIDVLTGGFPCQPFSYAGKRGGQTDDRYLWPEMLRVIDEIRPTWVVGENVAGITTMVESCEISEMGSETTLFEEGNRVHRFRAEHAFTIERICRDLESKGYTVQPMLIPACAVGAPHRRDRVFIMAHNTQRPRLEYTIDGRTKEEVFNEKTQRGQNSLPEHSGFSEAKSGRRSASDSDSRRRDEILEYIQSEVTDGAESVGNGGKWDAADSTGKQSKRRGIDKGSLSEEQEQSGRVGGESIARMLPGERWKGFPTVSPVHRGNDGLPFDVDNLAISFSKWRNESLKAYGNAIVPQVMYRIFQCIEETERLFD